MQMNRHWKVGGKCTFDEVLDLPYSHPSYTHLRATAEKKKK
jgi:hypothetical protein